MMFSALLLMAKRTIRITTAYFIQVILDPPTVQILLAHFQEDLRFAKQLSTENWNKRSALQRMKEILVRPFRENL